MKITFGRAIHTTVFFVIPIVMVLTINYHGCKDPTEYEPPFDSLFPPPTAPTLINPTTDTVFWFTTPFPHDIIFRWSQVENAEYYQLQVTQDSTQLPIATPVKAESSSISYTLTRKGIYFWRVRAYSRKWTWYTDWSKSSRFAAYYAP